MRPALRQRLAFAVRAPELADDPAALRAAALAYLRRRGIGVRVSAAEIMRELFGTRPPPPLAPAAVEEALETLVRSGHACYAALAFGGVTVPAFALTDRGMDAEKGGPAT